MRALLGIALVFATLVAFAASRQPPKPTGQQAGPQTQQAEQQPQTPKDDKRGTEEMPLVIKTDPKEAERKSADDAKERSEHASTDRWTIRIGVATFFILFVQAIVFWIQAKRLKESIRAMNRIAGDQHEDVKASIVVAAEAATASKASVDAMRVSNEISRQSMVADHRAWLSLVHVRFIEPSSLNDRDGLILTFSVAIKNFGSTPAMKAAVTIEVIYLGNKPIENFAGSIEQFKNKVRKPVIAALGSLIFPNETHVYKDRAGMSSADLKEVLANTSEGPKLSFVVLVAVGYRVAGDDRIHLTYHPYQMLNIAMNSSLRMAGAPWMDIPRLGFGGGEAD